MKLKKKSFFFFQFSKNWGRRVGKTKNTKTLAYGSAHYKYCEYNTVGERTGETFKITRVLSVL